MIWLLAVSAARASDWPQFLGPTRNGLSPETNLSAPWPADGPVTRWKKDVGAGFAGPAVAGGRLYLFERRGDKEIVDCLDTKNGGGLWRFDYKTDYQDDFGFDNGPRATPAVADGKVYTLGAEGVVLCLNAADGRPLWSVECKKRFQCPKGFFGMACSPLVESNLVIVNIGGADGAGVVAFDKSTGALRWKSGDDEAGYSSPVAASFDGTRYALVFTRAGLAGLNPTTGARCFDVPWRSREDASVNAATPIVDGNLIFLTASYGTGAVLLRVEHGGLKTVWSGGDSLSCHYATPVLYQGYLYGIDGRADPGMQPRPSLRCVELKTGRVCWSEDNFGAATVTLADGQLFILTENGELIRAPADPKAFHASARAQILPLGVRAYPALADGCLFARSKDKLVCVSLR